MKFVIVTTKYYRKETKHYLNRDHISQITTPSQIGNQYDWANAKVCGHFHNNGGYHVIETVEELLKQIQSLQDSKVTMSD